MIGHIHAAMHGYRRSMGLISMSTGPPRLAKTRWIFMGTTVGVIGYMSFQRRRTFIAQQQAKQPVRNRIHMPVRHDSEFHPLLTLPPPLLANFTIRNDPKSNLLTGALYRIVSDETEKLVSVVDIEADEPGTQELVDRYAISSIPTVVALKGGFVNGTYDMKDSKQVDWEDLKAWVENMAEQKK